MFQCEIRQIGAAFGCAAFVLLAGCNEQRIGGAVAGDNVLPIVAIVKDAGDTLTVAEGVGFTVNAVDNLGLKQISIDLAGGLTARLDTVFSTAVTSVSLPIQVVLPPNTTAGGSILITATALDGNDNAASAVDSVFLVNESALSVILTSPTNGAVTSAGKQLIVGVEAVQRDGVAKVGYLVTGAFAGGDSSATLTAPLPDTLVFQDTLTVPSSASPSRASRRTWMGAGPRVPR
jgi:hypothetical protein